MSSKGKIKIKDQLTDDVAAAGADRKPDREFSGPVGGACSENTREVHACGEENQEGDGTEYE
jgi:hypothetical protein